MREVVSDDIAVIGMACRFPGAHDVVQYWKNLVAGRVSVKEAPEARWRWRDYETGPASEESSSSCRWGGFIDDVDAFDAAFFNVSAREAEAMDPQQRLGLEMAWSCFEDAGLRPSHLSGQNVGVFLGFTNLDYKEIVEQSQINTYYATGTLSSVIPNRISYQLDLRGPSVAVDTACSSSLHAVHLACRALQNSECEMALTGGISLLLTPKRFIWYSKAGILSPTGELRTFDENANGTVRGEGVGFILLKPLARAIADSNRILGVIKGSAVNHGGKSPTLTYPSANAQAEVIVNALQTAGVDPSDISYIEAHGTGTVKGDPIEVQGLVQAFQFRGAGPQSRNGNHPWCGLGSVKPNIGHLEGAAGIAGIIKVLLAMRHKTLPPLANFSKPNSRISLGPAFYFANKAQPWEPGNKPRVAGVSSFGFAGTNAHVILAEAPGIDTEEAGSGLRAQGASVVVLSAKDPERLRERAGQLQHAVARQGFTDRDLEALAFTLQVGRDPMRHRLGFVAGSMEELEARLQQFVEGKSELQGSYLGEAEGPVEADGELQHAICQWREEGDASKLLELWTHGVEVDWERLHAKPKPAILSLPAYPFARERYWVSRPAGSSSSSSGPAAGGRLHLLVHQNTSDLSELRFSSVFTGEEFFFADHRIQGWRVLPAAAYLEMVREAVTRAVPRPERDVKSQAQSIVVKNLVWLRPLMATNEPVEVHIRLVPTSGEEVSFEIYSRSGPGEEVIHAQGLAFTGAVDKAPRLDVQELTRRSQTPSYSAKACYAAFQALQIDYGDEHRGIKGLCVEGNEVIASLSLAGSNPADGLVLHPGMLDSALQATIGFALASKKANGGMPAMLPFELQNAEIYGPSLARMWAVVRRQTSGGTWGGEQYDIDLCDEMGRVCVRLNGLSMRSIGPQRAAGRLDYPVVPNGNAPEQRTSPRRRLSSPFADALHREPPSKLAEEIAINGMSGMWARVRQREGKCDIDLCDEYGRVSVNFPGWTLRSPKGELAGALSVEAPMDGEAVLTPVWNRFAIDLNTDQQALTGGLPVVIGGTGDQRLAIQRLLPDARCAEIDPDESFESICGKIAALGDISHMVWIVPEHVPDDFTADSVIAGQRYGVLMGFRLVKALLAAGHGDRALTLTVLTTGVEAVHANGRMNPTHASVHGLMGSVANEYAGWRVRVMDLPQTGNWPWQDIFRLQEPVRGNVLVYRENSWYRQQLLPYRLLDEPPCFSRAEEVYIIIGGHSGIGAAWSEVLLRRTRVQLVWIGRRPIDNAIQSQINSLAKLGPAPFYISADATDRLQLERARSMVLQRFGHIDGLVHSAMVLRDQTLANITESAFREALEPKIDGCVRLAQVFGEDALRFVLFFSSCNTFIRSAGQSNYVAGCAFEDSFARRLAAHWRCRVRVMNWGYWGTVGAASSERYRSLMARKGLGSIDLPGATRILDELVSGGFVQLAYLKTSGRGALQDCDVRADEWTASYREAVPSCLPAISREAAKAAKWSPDTEWRSAGKELETIAGDLLWFQLQNAGLLGAENVPFEAAQSSTKVDTRLKGWFEHSLHLLQARGFLIQRGQQFEVSNSAPVDGAAAWKKWESWKKKWLNDPDWEPSIEMLEAALHALPDMLIGQRSAVDVLLADFFSSSTSAPLMARALRTQPAVRFCNQVMARTIIEYVQERQRRDPRGELRILELGTGTGATAETILEALGPRVACLKEYACTWAAMPLLSAARKWFHSEHPYVTYTVFDVEHAPDSQGIPIGSYDVVIASNSLYAARDIRGALRNAKAVMKTNALFVIHEPAANTMLNHCTAGLLDTWVFSDAELRMPGSSALLPDAWKTVLAQEGFGSVLFLAEEVHDYGRQVIAAESDGLIRQRLARPTFLSNQPEEMPDQLPGDVVEKGPIEASSRPTAVDEIMGGSRDAAIEYLLSRVRVHTAAALGIDAAMLDLQGRSFADMLPAELGVDSLSSNDLRNALRQEFGVDLPVHRIIGDPVQRTVDALYDELLIRRISSPGNPETSVDRETYVF
jgi:acyl transferase domain-containing protein/NAD(P)-dependent dehydrogenase (short-subunit alcohol dehydrogenase family)/SAM-dependent methyltransferase